MLDRLPGEILEEIVDHVVTPASIPAYTFHLNLTTPGWKALLALSLTLVALRQALAPRLFAFLLLVRTNQIDSLLQATKDCEQYSDHLTYDRQFLSEVLQRNVDECRYADSARTSFRVVHDASRYEKFSMNLLVLVLECDKLVQLRWFPNITALKMFDEGPWSSEPIHLPHLRYLAANFDGARAIVAPDLQRLDLLADFDKINPTDFVNWQPSPSITELNVFVDHPFVFKYEKVLNWLQQFENITTFSARVSHRKRDEPETAYSWHVAVDSGDAMAQILHRCHHITLDLLIINCLEFSPHHPPFCKLDTEGATLILVEPFLAVSKLAPTLQQKLARIIMLSHVSRLGFQFGEVVDNSDLTALALILNLLLGLHQNYRWTAITQVSIEKCWSRIDEMILRRFWMEPKSQPLATATVWGRIAVNTPRFRRQESFAVDYTPSAGDVDCLSFAPTDGTVTNMQFWSVELAKIDLEQYTLPQRKRSGIWA